MALARSNSAGAHFSPDEYWITGGYVSLLNETDSTELYTAGSGFANYTDLPRRMKKHNLVALNATHMMALGGDPRSAEVSIFDRCVCYASQSHLQIPQNWVHTVSPAGNK